MGSQLDAGLFLHPFQHIVDAFHPHRPACRLSLYINKQQVLTLQKASVLRQIMHEEFEGVVADLGGAILGIFCTGIVIVVIPEIHLEVMLCVVDVFGVIKAEDFPDPKAGFRNQQEQKLVTDIGAGFQNIYNFNLIRRTDVSIFLL